MFGIVAKFNKILTINIPEFKLEKRYWDEIGKLADKRVDLPKDSLEIKTELKDADCVLIGFGVKMGKDEIDMAPKLKYIGSLATGYGGVDTKYAKARNIVVTNIPGYCTQGVAEFVIAIILNQLRDLGRGIKQVKEGNYSEAGFSPTEIKGKIFGVLGAGRIGTRVAELAKGFGADVRYWSRNKKGELESKGVKYQEADILIPMADFLSLNFSLCPDTTEFLNEKRISKIKSGAIVVNAAPMELVNLKALEKRLQKGDITFILDHSDEMTPENIAKLMKYDNCVIYPPIGYVTKEAGVAKQEIFVDNLENFLKGKPVNRVN